MKGVFPCPAKCLQIFIRIFKLMKSICDDVLHLPIIELMPFTLHQTTCTRFYMGILHSTSVLVEDAIKLAYGIAVCKVCAFWSGIYHDGSTCLYMPLAFSFRNKQSVTHLQEHIMTATFQPSDLLSCGYGARNTLLNMICNVYVAQS